MAISPDQKPLETGIPPKTDAAVVIGDRDLSGKTAIVTGGYSGIGLETTKALLGAGAKVVVPVRTPEKAEPALAELDGDVFAAPMDLADLSSVRKFADEFLSAMTRCIC